MRQQLTRMMCLAAAAVAAGAGGVSPPAAQAQVEAYSGQPFGVARVTFQLPAGDMEMPLLGTAPTVTAPDHRALYPAFEGLRRRLRYWVGPAPTRLSVLFLFRGDEPFDVTIATPTPQTIQVVPRQRLRVAHQGMLRRWWRAYNAPLREQAAESDYSPLVETYLSATLSRRLNLPSQLLQPNAPAGSQPTGRHTLQLLAGDESLRRELLSRNCLGLDLDTQPADRELPAAPAWRQWTFAGPDADAAIEPIALRVPRECFYVRFGQYPNFTWFNALIEDYGGDIRGMFPSRSVRHASSRRVQDQLALEQGILAELLGPHAISDVAMIGLDTFLHEGAAIGALFEATGDMLAVDLVRQRQEALFREREQGATMSTIQIGGHDVSFLSTPDNRLRSYYLIDGKYHLVTNCRRLVERFLEVRDGRQSLGASDEFRHARAAMPLSRADTVFVYFSAAFFQNLLSPAYQIELARRQRAATDIEHIMLARLAAANEGVRGDTLDQLMQAGLVPPGLGRRPDGSRPILDGPRVTDSLRGARGHFTPVPDVDVTAVSTAEAEGYVAQSAYWAEHPSQMDPLLMAVKRETLDGPRQERLTIDAIISPLSGTKYEWYLSLLGEPTRHRLAPPAGNLVSLEASLGGGLLFPAVPPHTLFLGVQDRPVLRSMPPGDAPGLWQTFRTLPAYLGAWPKPGFLDMLPPRIIGSTPAEGITPLLLGIWRWQGRGFSVLATDPEILQQVDQEIGFQELDQPAQFRARVGDLSHAQFRNWIDAWAFTRGRNATTANTLLLATLTQQLGVPQADALEVAERLLDAQLVCPLGGQYLLQTDGKAPVWASSAATGERGVYQPPADYSAPILTWFRGLDARLLRHQDRLVLRAQLDLQRPERQPRWKLPFWE